MDDEPKKTKKKQGTAAERVAKAQENRLRMREMIIRTVEEKVATAVHYGMAVEQGILEDALKRLRETVTGGGL